MLVTITRPPLRLLGGADPVIEDMVNLMPDYSAGRRLHTLYVNKLQSALPGNYSQVFGTGPAFRGVFYPSWQADGLLPFVGETGLDDGWWRGFSVAVLCQAIRELGSDIRGQMLTDKINGDVASYNATLRTRSARTYARVLGAVFEPLVALLRQVNPQTAKQEFHDSLLNNVLNRQLWYQAGVWTSPDWEMFNQYAKYIVLGASDGEVDALIDELSAAGLPIPGQVGKGTWRTYEEELRDKRDVDLEDVRSACAGPIAQTTYIPTGYMPAQIPNGNCYEFTANSQPGNLYRRPPGGSCFTGATQVLGANGVAVALSELDRGDTVLTRDGLGTVAYIARPLRSGRPLFGLAGGGPVFTATHPFANGAVAPGAAAPPAVLAVDPVLLASDVPTLSEDGIGRLEAGSTLLARAPGPDQPTVTVTVAGVEQVPAVDGDEPTLYDVRLETTTGARQEFWAGDGASFFLVTPEYPVLDEAGAAAVTVVALMEGLLEAGGPEGDGWPGWVIGVVDRFGPGVFLNALSEALATTPSYGAPPPGEPVYERIDRLYQAMSGVTTETGSVVASMFDGLLSAVGQWLSSVVALGWRTSSLLGGELLAVTVFDVALTPANPVPSGTEVRLDVTVTDRTLSDSTYLWDHRGRSNTRFHHYFDQLIHLDLTGEERPAELCFAVQVHDAPIPTLLAAVPDPAGVATHALRSTPLRDAGGSVMGDIRFDTRRIGRDAASQELLQSGLWTEEAAEAYAEALGAAMVAPVLWKLRELAPRLRP